MSIWNQLGFRENLYATPPLQATAEGNRLLVGRDDDIDNLLSHLRSLDTHPTIEGDNGVGKTSLVAVATYRAKKDFEAGRSKQLFLSIPHLFQLDAPLAEIENEIFFNIAKTLLDNREYLRHQGRSIANVAAVDSWLQSPIVKAHQGGFSVLGSGLNYGQSAEANTSQGFLDVGFREEVKTWLRAAFPTPNSGGLVGVIDNLELLETSQEARKRLGEMRDAVLKLDGVRWVLCGARGIVRSAVGAPRLTGVVGDPIRLDPLRHDDVPSVVERRIAEYKIRDDAVAPVEPEGFDHLYRVSNKNLRISLKHAQDFTLWLSREKKLETSSTDRLALLEAWLAEQAENYERDTRNITPRGWEYFDALARFGGSCSPSDHEEFGFNKPQNMRPYVKQLEDANLIDSSIDESDSRRRTISMTSNGWLIDYKRRGYKLIGS